MNILTFDIEDWYNCDFISGNFNWDNYEVRIYENTLRILDELDKQNKKGTFFCLGWIAEKHPDIIKEIDKRGHHIGCHSYQHELVFRFTREEFRADTLKAKHLIENVINKPINTYRAPGFSITQNNLWAFEELADMGFEYDCSIFPAVHDYGGLPKYGEVVPKIIELNNGRTIKEFPINIQTTIGQHIVFSGGGYFRLFPYFLIKHWAKQTDYMMTYFHPRDFDPNQPKLNHLPLMRKFKSYIGLQTSFRKFQRLLNDYEFITIKEANLLIDWNKTDKLQFNY